MLAKREGRGTAEAEQLPISFYRESNLRMVQEVISYARSQGVHHMELAAEDASRSHIDYLIRLVRVAAEAGVERYGFADTTGSLTPESTRFYLVQLRKSLGKLPILTHFHNDFDLATINTIVALSLGIPIFSCTVNGIGERAGNTSLHAVVVALKLLYDITIPNFKYEKLWGLRRLVEGISGLPLQAHEPVVGINTFAHESGIHVHGVMTEPRTYEPIPPELVGGERRFVFGKHGGTGLVRAFLEKHAAEFENGEGEITDLLVQQVLAGIKRRREEKAEEGVTYQIVDDYYKGLSRLEITDQEVLAIARAHVLLALTQAI
jgi:isopropylmalate/homocitrate/citramalate synthase